MHENIPRIIDMLKADGTAHLSNDETGHADIDQYYRYTICRRDEQYEVVCDYSTNDACTPGSSSTYSWDEARLLKFLHALPKESLDEVYLSAPISTAEPVPVVLYAVTRDDLKVKVTAYYKEDGSLIVDGCDSGESVKIAWDDWDYEYSITIKPPSFSTLAVELKVRSADRQGILNAIAAQFSGPTAFSDFQDFLKRWRIRHEFFSWT